MRLLHRLHIDGHRHRVRQYLPADMPRTRRVITKCRRSLPDHVAGAAIVPRARLTADLACECSS